MERLRWIAWAGILAGCSGRPIDLPETSRAPDDLSVVRDLEVPPDEDLGVPPDLAIAPQPDLAPPPDLRPALPVVATSNTAACALVRGGVQCWGSNQLGQLGDGTSVAARPSPGPVPSLTSGVVALAGAGGDHFCALLADGSVRCWGDSVGTVDDAGQQISRTPIPVDGLPGIPVELKSGGDHSCARFSDGTLACWGRNDYGQCGGPLAQGYFFTPRLVDGVPPAVAVDVHGDTSCALTAAGAVFCWGDYLLGDGVEQPTPMAIASLASSVKQLALPSAGVCALTTAGGVRCLGADDGGIFIAGHDGFVADAVGIPGLDGGVRALAGGYANDCAIGDDGRLRCWGYNRRGELGDGTHVDRPSPAPVPGLDGVAAAAIGMEYACAVLSTGEVECWGANDSGQLGDGTTVDRASPAPVVGL